jgi:hypothetical protein
LGGDAISMNVMEGVMEEKLVAVDLEYPVGVAGSSEDTRVSGKVITAVIQALSDIVVSAINGSKQK